MGLLDSLKEYLNKRITGSRYAVTTSGYAAVFSNFGTDIYANESVMQCVRCIAQEMQKLQPHHIIVRDQSIKIADSSIEKLFINGPNPMMTTADFLGKITFLLFRDNNVFIYHAYDIYTDSQGNQRKRYRGLYPFRPENVTFLQDPAGNFYLELHFGSGEKFTLPYERVTHWRYDYSVNDYMGGNETGRPNNDALLNTLSINHDLEQGLAKGVKASLGVRGILKYKLLGNQITTDEDVAKFEERIANSNTGILGTDMRAEYIDIKPDPKLIDKDTLEHLDLKVLRHFGVSIPILNGTATPSEHQAFFQRTLEPLIITLTQALNKTIFSPTERAFGNEIRLYSKNLVFLNMQERLEFIKIAGPIGALTNNQILDTFDLPPYEGGDVRYVSLNYINANIIDQYQLAKVSGKGAPLDDGIQNGEE